jgi:ACS family sodium-dependent inorganic phosphate cotransporter
VQVFFAFGAAGLCWSAWWETVVKGIEESDPEAFEKLTSRVAGAAGGKAMPWRAFLRNTPMRALAYTHFCNNWCGGGA